MNGTSLLTGTILRICIFKGKRSIHSTEWLQKNTKSLPQLEKKVSKKRVVVDLLPNTSSSKKTLEPKSKEGKKEFNFKNSPEIPIHLQSESKGFIRFGDEELLLPAGLWDNLAVDCEKKKSLSAASSATVDQLDEPLSSIVVKDNPEESTTFNNHIKINLPNEPFYEKNNIILPFPMVVGKKLDLNTSKDISSISSPELKFPSVTQILKDTMSKESEILLEKWRRRKVSEVGEEGFKEFMRDAILTGKQLHTSIETRLRGVPYDAVHVEPRISGHWLSLKSVLGSLEDVQALESCVVHPQLKYKGFVDCVARHNGHLVAIEWKSSQRIKNNLKQAYDDPVQIAAYIGALNADTNYAFEVENALLVVAYPTGRAADVMVLDRKSCEHYWLLWLKRLEAFNRLRHT